MTMKVKMWTAEETELLVKKMLSGESYEDIAKYFGVSYWKVCSKVNNLRNNGVNIPYQPHYRRKVDYEKLKRLVAESEQE